MTETEKAKNSDSKIEQKANDYIFYSFCLVALYIVSYFYRYHGWRVQTKVGTLLRDFMESIQAVMNLTPMFAPILCLFTTLKAYKYGAKHKYIYMLFPLSVVGCNFSIKYFMMFVH